MSGVGEAIAIVSCVAGLIQALDSGSKIVRQIKQRREAHRASGGTALPPSDNLEKTIEDGKAQIEQIVAKGNARFGNNFEAGDDTAEIALLRIENRIQNALLQRLTVARIDDGIVDFDECIDLSDQGVNDALVALQALYQRKLKEDMERKQREAKQSEDEEKAQQQRQKEAWEREQQQEQQQRTINRQDTVPASKPALKQTHSAPAPLSVNTQQSSPSQTERKKSRGLGGIFGSRSKTEQNEQLLTPAPSPHRRETAPVLPAHIQPTHTTPPQTSHDANTAKRMSRASSTSQGSIASGNANIPPTGPPYNWSPNMSRQSTLASLPDVAISTYYGCCKYAHITREKNWESGLGLTNLAFHGEHWVYKCKSIKCSFALNAVKVKRNWEVDNKIFTSREGIQYRWMFLVKSHAPIPLDCPPRQPRPYKCLVCLVLQRSSDTYYGSQQLLTHISKHQEKAIGDTALAGPLSFTNQGAAVSSNEKFDLAIPETASLPAEPEAEHGTPKVVTEVQKKLEEFAMSRGSKAPSVVSYSTVSTSSSVPANADPAFNPWAFHG